MIIHTPRVNALFDKTVQGLIAKGRAPSPRQCVWLYDLCQDAVTPDRGEVCAWLPAPVTLGRLSLYPMTMQAHIWLDEYASKWWATDDVMDVLATAWASVHARRADAFSRMTSRAFATGKLAIWGATMPYTLDQLREALRRLMGAQDGINLESPAEPKAPADPLEWGEVLARAAAALKITPDEALLLNIEVIGDIQRAAAREDGQSPAMDSSKLRALEALRLAVKHIEESPAHE
jgi:hypothetical protein